MVLLGLTMGSPFGFQVRRSSPTARLRLRSSQPTGMFLNNLMGRIHGILDGSEEEGSSFKSMDLNFMKEMTERKLNKLLTASVTAQRKRSASQIQMIPVAIVVTPKPGTRTNLYKPARAGFSPWG